MRRTPRPLSLSLFFLGMAAVVIGHVDDADAAPVDETVREECIAGYEEGQRLSLDGKLRASRAKFLICARAACPKITQEDCSKWLTALDPKLPSVLISAKDASGKDIENLRVVVDGEQLADHLDGRPIEVDPGAHTFRYEHANANAANTDTNGPTPPQVIEERVVIMEGEKNRRLQVSFPAPPPTKPQETKGPDQQQGDSDKKKVPTLTWVFAGVSLVALSSFVGFAVSGKDGEGCAPNCSRDNVDDFRRDFLIADLSLTVGLIAAGAAVYFFLREPSRPAPRTTTQLRLR